MVERFQYEESKKYPGNASVIFWTNGPELRLNNDGTASLTKDSDAGPYYLEAELNSPTYRLRPGEACDFETEWFPTRAGDRKSTRLNSSHQIISYAVFCLKKKKIKSKSVSTRFM